MSNLILIYDAGSYHYSVQPGHCHFSDLRYAYTATQGYMSDMIYLMLTGNLNIHDNRILAGTVSSCAALVEE